MDDTLDLESSYINNNYFDVRISTNKEYTTTSSRSNYLSSAPSISSGETLSKVVDLLDSKPCKGTRQKRKHNLDERQKIDRKRKLEEMRRKERKEAKEDREQLLGTLDARVTQHNTGLRECQYELSRTKSSIISELLRQGFPDNQISAILHFNINNQINK